MKIQYNPIITTELIKSLHPCLDRFDNWCEQYIDFKGNAVDFLSLDGITAADKTWVCCRILPRELIEVFAIDCAVNAATAAATAADAATAYAADAATATAATAADAAYATTAADAATATTAAYAAAATAAYAAYAADAYAADAYDAAYAAAAAERERQVDCLIYLINEFSKDGE